MAKRHGKSQYKDSYCQLIKDVFSRGDSLAHFCVEIGNCRRVVYDWIDKYPAFAQAYETAKEMGCAHHLERSKELMQAKFFNDAPYRTLGKPFELMLSNQNLTSLHKRGTVQREIKLIEKLYCAGEISIDDAAKLIKKASDKLDINLRSQLTLRVDELEKFVQMGFSSNSPVISPTAEAVALTEDEINDNKAE